MSATLTRQTKVSPPAGTRMASWVMPPPFFQGVAVKDDRRMICSLGNGTDCLIQILPGSLHGHCSILQPMRTGDDNTAIPLLDLHRFDSADAQRGAFLAELREAAHDVGFFYVTGHGVDTQLLDGLLQSARRFFSLPERDKLAIEMVNSAHFRGYNRVAAERTRGRPDRREQIDIGAERPALPRDGGFPVWGPAARTESMAGLASPNCVRWSLAGRQRPSKSSSAYCALWRWRWANPPMRSSRCTGMTRITW